MSISTTSDRAKGRNLARDSRAALHVSGDDFWDGAMSTGGPRPLPKPQPDQA